MAKTTKKKIKEDLTLKIEKDNLENKKRVYEVYLKALIEYNPSQLAYSAIMADELYHNELLRVMGDARKNDVMFTKLIFGEPSDNKPTELEIIKGDQKYYDRLIKLCEHRIKELPFDIKMKIAKDSIEKMDAWFGLGKYDNFLKSKKKRKQRSIESDKIL